MPAAFLDKLELEYIDGRQWRVTQPFRYQTEAGKTITVPMGFVTDFASIPRGLWNVMPPTSTCGEAAVVHDFAYTQQCCTRAEADAILYEAMGVIHATRWTRWTVYAGVRLGGWGIWRRHTAELRKLQQQLTDLGGGGDCAA